MDGRGREMYRKFDGASGDAFVTVLTHDRVQLAYFVFAYFGLVNESFSRQVGALVTL